MVYFGVQVCNPRMLWTMDVKCSSKVVLLQWLLLSPQDNYSYMLGHYMVFLVHFHDRVFFWTGAIYSKMNFINLDAASGDRFSSSDLLLFSNASDKNIGIPTGFPGLTALLSWICPRYQYHFPMEGIFLFSAMLMRPMAYFYSLIQTGNKLNLITVLMFIRN